MATKNLGKVAFVFKDDYSSLTTYDKYDVVFDGESSYISLITNNLGNALSNTSYWKPLCKGNYLAISGKADKTINITAGAGLTGGGTLEANRAINVGATDDSIVVADDGIKVDTQNSLTSTSTTKPLAANQGKVLNDGLIQLGADLNQFSSSVNKHRIAIDEISNFYQNADETLTPSDFLAGATLTTPANTDNLPLASSYLPKKINMSWGGSIAGEAKIQIANSGFTTIFSLGFWIDKNSWNNAPNKTLGVYSGTAWMEENLNNLNVGFRRTFDFGNSKYLKLEVLSQVDNWIYMYFTTDSYQITNPYIYIRFDTTEAAYTSGINIANFTFVKDSIVPLDPFIVYRHNSDSLPMFKNKKTEKALIASVINNIKTKQLATDALFYAEKEQVNNLYNSGESGYPQSLWSGGIVTQIDTPTDCPFSTTILPKIISYTGTGTGDFKIEFPTSLIGTGEITFSFWTKKTQIPLTYIQTFNGSSWININIPTTVGDTTTVNANGSTILKRVYEYGDWVMLQFQYTDHVLTTFRLRFASNLTTTMYFANVIALNTIADISPFCVRYKTKYSTVSKKLENVELRLSVLENPNTIVCYGDSLTAGFYPSYLQTDLGGNYTVYNRGVGGENTLSIIGRQGGSPMYISNVTIPADTTPIILGNLSNSGIKSLFNDSIIYPLLQHTANAGINNCYVEGIECILKWTGATYNDVSGTYTLERVTAGTAKTTSAKAIIFTENMRLFKNPHLAIVFMGQNGGWTDANTLVSQFKKMTEFLSQKRFIVITSHGSGTTQSVIDAMSSEFGAAYIDLRTYMSKYGIADAITAGYLPNNGTYPTQADIDAMALGNCPPSLLVDSIHFNSTGYHLLTNQIRQKMKELGY